jgi:hypothetical protein
MREGFKVVSPRGDKLVSFLAPFGAEVEYSSEKWTEPNPGYGPLTVFSTIRDAKAFCKRFFDLYDFEVWSCEYIPWSQKLREVPATGVPERKIRAIAWTLDGRYQPAHFAPLGTVPAEKVRLKERLWFVYQDEPSFFGGPND